MPPAPIAHGRQVRPVTIRWGDIEIFLVVARLGSLAKAAPELGVDASTVSRRIKALEAAIERPLFVRNRDGLALTDEGNLLFASATEMAVGADKFYLTIDQFRVNRPILVSAPEVIVSNVLMPVLHREELGPFARVLKRVPPDSLRDMMPVLEGTGRMADIRLCWAVPNMMPQTEKDMAVRKICTVRFLPHFTDAYEAAHGTVASFADLARHRLGTLETYDYFHHRRSLAAWNSTVEAAQWPARKVVTYSALERMVGNGSVIGLFPSWQGMVMPGLKVLKDGPVMELDLWRVTPQVVRHFPAVQSLASVLEQVLWNVNEHRTLP